MHGMIKRGMVVLAVVAVVWPVLACERATEPTPEPTAPVVYDDPATLCASEGENITVKELARERAKAVREKHKELFRRQPNLTGFGVGVLRDADGNFLWDDIGIIVHVSEKVDQSTLPEQDRIPGSIEGVPVQFVKGERLENLGGWTP